MILLLGGTSDTAPVAETLAQAGYDVLVSTATEIPLNTGSHPAITHRHGRLSESAMASLAIERGVRAIVDATHPYAIEVRATAASVAATLGIPYLSYVRPGTMTDNDGLDSEGVCVVASHEEAARLAFATGHPVLLTIGSRAVRVYGEEMVRTGAVLVARVLDHPDSHLACREAGIPLERIITGRGPFSVEANRELIRRFNIGVLVTKDSGDAGGVREKLEAARLEGCRVIVVGRPEAGCKGGFASIAELVHALRLRLPVKSRPRCTLLALDLESVLVPEIWETVARITGVAELALTTRDIPDYGLLMQRRMALCREHGLSLFRLREIVAAMEPLPGALDFLRWAEGRSLVVLVSDTYHELAGPLVAKLGCPLMICNGLTLDDAGYITGYQLRDPAGKAGAVAHFQRLGMAVCAVGDSFNDLMMLRAADAALLFRPAAAVAEAGSEFSSCWSFDELTNAVQSHL